MTRPFCGACSRLRVTADGKVRPCLFSLSEWDLKPLLRRGAADGEIRRFLVDSMWTKQAGPYFSARHGIPAAHYQAVFDNHLYQSYEPAYLQAFNSGSGVRFNAIWTNTVFKGSDLELIDRKARDYLRDTGMPGVSIAVMRGKRLVYAAGFGVADKDNGMPMSPRHRLRVASVSKPVTHVAVLKLPADTNLDATSKVFGSNTFMLLNRDDARVMAMLPPPVKVRLKAPQVRPHATFGAGEPQRPGDYGIETVNGMTWLVRAAEAVSDRKAGRERAETPGDGLTLKLPGHGEHAVHGIGDGVDPFPERPLEIAERALQRGPRVVHLRFELLPRGGGSLARRRLRALDGAELLRTLLRRAETGR